MPTFSTETQIINNITKVNNMFFMMATVFAYRLLKLKLKESENLFVTNSSGTLRLMPPYDTSSQTVVVHNRKLSFIKDSLLYKMYLDPKSLEIKLKRDLEEGRRKVGFLKSGVRKTKVNPFKFGRMKSPKAKKKEEVKDDPPVWSSPPKISKVKSNGNRESNNRESFNNREVHNDRDNINNREINKWQTNNNMESINNRDSINNRESITNREITSREIQTNDPNPEEDDSVEVLKTILASLGETEEKGVISKIKKYFKPKEESNYIESDSKIDDDASKYQRVDVFVSSLDRTYFKLKTSSNNCVTFLNDSFIFSPCLDLNSQIFKLVKEEEVEKEKPRKKKYTSTKYTPKKYELLSYDKKMRKKYQEEECPTRNSEEYRSLCDIDGEEYDEEACEALKDEIEACEAKNNPTLDSSTKVPPKKKEDLETRMLDVSTKSDDSLLKPVDESRFLRPVTDDGRFLRPRSNSNSNSNNNRSLNTNSIPNTNTPNATPNTKIPNNNNTLKPNIQNTPNYSTKPEQKSTHTNLLRNIIKSETAKKDFNPDDIIEKLKNSINSNDLSDFM